VTERNEVIGRPMVALAVPTDRGEEQA